MYRLVNFEIVDINGCIDLLICVIWRISVMIGDVLNHVIRVWLASQNCNQC